MSSDRMATVLRVRELAERRRLAERAAAARALGDSREEHAAAVQARAEGDVPPGTWLQPAQLVSARMTGIALDEAVTQASQQQIVAEQRLAGAERHLTAAAMQRRSAERLRDRRQAAIAREAQRRELRRSDDVALQQWRARP